MFNLKLIEDFRGVANKGLIQKKYRNIDGKNKWNIMCSAIDWIEVSANGLPEIKLRESASTFHSDIISLNVMQYLMAIDSMVEAIIQLYRVIWGEDNYPLKGDKNVGWF